MAKTRGLSPRLRKGLDRYVELHGIEPTKYKSERIVQRESVFEREEGS